MTDKKEILIIDDEKDFCFFVKKNLEQRGDFSVLIATDPDKGIRIAKRKTPDLILLDISMPKKDGFTVLDILKKNTKTIFIPVVLLTAVVEDDAKVKASGLYGEDYITKPVASEALAAKIDEVFIRHNRFLTR